MDRSIYVAVGGIRTRALQMQSKFLTDPRHKYSSVSRADVTKMTLIAKMAITIFSYCKTNT